jgi:hypothetical protein
MRIAIRTILLSIFTVAAVSAALPTASHCGHDAAVAADRQAPCCPMQAMLGAACALACQPVITQSYVAGPAEPQSRAVRFFATERQLSDRALRPPVPPPRPVVLT